jgi:hypothetical protein
MKRPEEVRLSREEGEEVVLTRAVSLISTRLGYLLTRVFIVEDDGTLSRSIRGGIGQQPVTESATIHANDANWRECKRNFAVSGM